MFAQQTRPGLAFNEDLEYCSQHTTHKAAIPKPGEILKFKNNEHYESSIYAVAYLGRRGRSATATQEVGGNSRFYTQEARKIASKQSFVIHAAVHTVFI